jgi:alginate O-acetyltransferase complex protein AlgI
MLFSSFDFLVFFPIVTLAYFLLPEQFRNTWLLLSSCFFYMFLIPYYIIILLGTISTDFIAGKYIYKENNPRRKKQLLTLSLIINIGILFFFKYYNFFASEFAQLFGTQNTDDFLFQVVLPIGLSFHTFQSMSYTIEIYRGHCIPEKNYFRFMLFVMFYPQLVAGPIERPQNLLHQFNEKKTFEYDRVKSGLWLMLVGFFKKIVVADRLSVLVDSVYANPDGFKGIPTLLAILFFTIQIYCDFSGYTDIARGAARVMGFELMENFRLPYFSKSIGEFWSRWHISLSSWFKDYVYIPLGGNKVNVYKVIRNVFIVFLVSGLWHGANWTFIVWGAAHGLVVIVERLTHFSKSKFSTYFGTIYSFLIVSILWVFFRAENLNQAFEILKNALQFPQTGIGVQFRGLGLTVNDLMLSGIFAVLLFTHDLFTLKVNIYEWVQRRSAALRWTIYYILVILVIFYSVTDGTKNFIYFQF